MLYVKDREVNTKFCHYLIADRLRNNQVLQTSCVSAISHGYKINYASRLGEASYATVPPDQIYSVAAGIDKAITNARHTKLSLDLDKFSTKAVTQGISYNKELGLESVALRYDVPCMN